MKRRLSVSLLVLLTLLTAGMFWSSAPVQAQSSGPVTITVPDFEWDRSSSIQRIPLEISGANASVLSFEFDITVDSSKFVPVSTSQANTILSDLGWTVSLRRTGQNLFHVEGYGGQGLRNRQGPLIYIVVQRTTSALSGGVPVAFEVENLIFNAGDPPAQIGSQGSITLYPILVSGEVEYGQINRPVPGVAVGWVKTDDSQVVGQEISSGSGAYLVEVSERGTYSFSFSKTPRTDLRNGISPLDAARVHQCSMGYRNDCDQEVADVNGDGKITSYDAALIANWLLTNRPIPGSKVGDWVCIPSNLGVGIQQDMALSEVICLLVGDVTKNWSSQSDLRISSSAVVSTPENIRATAGLETSVPVSVTGVQMEAVLLRFDSNATVVGFELPEGWSVTLGDEGFLLMGETAGDQINFGIRIVAQNSGEVTFKEVWVNEESPQPLDASVQIDVTHFIFIPAVQRMENQ